MEWIGKEGSQENEVMMELIVKASGVKECQNILKCDWECSQGPSGLNYKIKSKIKDIKNILERVRFKYKS